MIEYIYFVKCPNCEDEHFNFFDEAKEFALGCLSQKPIITQTEISRNDFGECTDHCDLGTVWSWEDMMQETEAEPAVSVFTKDALKCMADGHDPEFDNLDNSLDTPAITEDDQRLASNKRGDYLVKASSGHGYTVFNRNNVCRGGLDCDTDEEAIRRFNFGDLDEAARIPVLEGMTIEQLVEEIEENEDPEVDNLDNSVDVEITEGLEHIQYCPSCGTVNDYADSQDNGSFIRYTCRDCNNTWDIDKPRKPAIDSVEATDRKLISLVQDSIKGPLADRVGSSGFYSENGQRFMAIPVSTNSDAYDFESYKKELQQVFPNTDIYCVMDDSEIIIDVTSFYSERKPIPEGMTLKELVEAMEENEDTVECTWCEELFDKSECRKEVNLGWLCSRCEMAIKSRGETLTFREGSYWDFLDEDITAERSIEDLVRDSINHLVNDLGKDPWAEDFADDVIGDLERNYTSVVPEDFNKYQDWCSAVACEVSRQVNRTSSKLEELEEAADYRKRLVPCPECGTNESFDHDTGICLECGFNV